MVFGYDFKLMLNVIVLILLVLLFFNIIFKCFWLIKCWLSSVNLLLNSGDLKFCLNGFVWCSKCVKGKYSFFDDKLLLESKVWFLLSFVMCVCVILIKVCLKFWSLVMGKFNLVVMVCLLNFLIMLG